MANSNGWGDGAANNAIGWGQGANNNIGWGDSHAKSWAGLTDIVGLTTDADAQAFITAAAITDATQKSAIDTLVKGMKADGIWTKMKAIYPFVGGTASAHKWNLKDPRDSDAAFRLVFNGGWTHSSNGALPNGTNGYADTKLNQSVNLTNISLHSSYYINSGNFTNGSGEIGIATSNTWLLLRADGKYFNQCDLDLTTTTSSYGMYCASRTSNVLRKGYFNGNAVITSTSSSNATANLNYYIGGLNSAGVAGFFSTLRTAFASIGDGLTDTEAANLYTRVQAYQTALSRQV
jgi:hypothetical protein